jgi:hypothetical protein
VTVRLDEYTKDEWYSIIRQAVKTLREQKGGVRADLTREEFEPMWVDFQKAKAERQRQQRLN